jgi:hypothetical protein
MNNEYPNPYKDPNKQTKQFMEEIATQTNYPYDQVQKIMIEQHALFVKQVNGMLTYPLPSLILEK